MSPQRPSATLTYLENYTSRKVAQYSVTCEPTGGQDSGGPIELCVGKCEAGPPSANARSASSTGKSAIPNASEARRVQAATDTDSLRFPSAVKRESCPL